MTTTRRTGPETGNVRVQKNDRNRKNLSARGYALLGLTMIVVGIGMLVLMVKLAPEMPQANLVDKFYYVVLIVWGLITAIFTFGVMEGYARITSQKVGTKIELRGSAAVFALVVIGGLFHKPETFILTVRPHGPNASLINKGQIRVEGGSFKETVNIDDGQAVFPYVPLGLSPVRVLPMIDGYRQEYQSLNVPSNDVIELNLVRISNDPISITVYLEPKPSLGQARILFENENDAAKEVALGRFEAVLHNAKIGQTIKVDVCENGRRVYDRLTPIDNPLLIKIVRPPENGCPDVVSH